MSLNAGEFSQLFADVETFYKFQMPPIALSAYLRAFNRQGWGVEDLRDAIESTIEKESGFGRIPPATVFIERFSERRKEEAEADLMQSPEYAELVEAVAQRDIAIAEWNRITDPWIKAQCWGWRTSLKELRERKAGLEEMVRGGSNGDN